MMNEKDDSVGGERGLDPARYTPPPASRNNQAPPLQLPEPTEEEVQMALDAQLASQLVG